MGLASSERSEWYLKSGSQGKGKPNKVAILAVEKIGSCKANRYIQKVAGNEALQSEQHEICTGVASDLDGMFRSNDLYEPESRAYCEEFGQTIRGLSYQGIHIISIQNDYEYTQAGFGQTMEQRCRATERLQLGKSESGQ
ncbi:hypothetical protein C8R43DRAFT_948455 [Mycena crocata]|nr:hypothetical protein C8R43DRAFT_948455 [Mycena crocata]